MDKRLDKAVGDAFSVKDFKKPKGYPAWFIGLVGFVFIYLVTELLWVANLDFMKSRNPYLMGAAIGGKNGR